jgi:hypothetical protein
MRSWIRLGMLGIALSSSALADAQTDTQSLIPSSDDCAIVENHDDDMTGGVGTVGVSRHEGPQLTMEDQAWIFLGVINLPDVPDVEMQTDELSVALPSKIELRDLPAFVTLRIPDLHDHKFVKLDDRILVVRPDDRVVIAEIARYRLLQ